MIPVPRTLLEALVSWFPLGERVVRTLPTAELAGLGLRSALHPPETRLALANVGNVPTERPAESFWAQAPHHLGGRTKRD